MKVSKKQRTIKQVKQIMEEVICISAMADHYTLYSTAKISELTIYDIGNNVLDLKLGTHENILYYANLYLTTLKNTYENR